MGWAALCGCVSLFMATGGARWCVQTGHLTFHRTDESNLSPIRLLSWLHCSGATEPQMNLPAIVPDALHIMPLLSSLSWIWYSSGFKAPSFFLWENSAGYPSLTLVVFTGTGLMSWWAGPVLGLCKTARMHLPLLRFSSPPACTHTCKLTHTTLPVLAKIKLRKNWN